MCSFSFSDLLKESECSLLDLKEMLASTYLVFNCDKASELNRMSLIAWSLAGYINEEQLRLLSRLNARLYFQYLR